MSILRTPRERFADLPGYPWKDHRVDAGPGEMAYVDVAGDGPETFLCLHGEPSWSYLYRKMIPILAERGRVVAPDFLGFGRSDKFDEPDAYSYAMHLEALNRFLEKLDLQDVTLVCQDWGGLLGLRAAAVDQADRFARIVAMNTSFADGTQGMPEEWQAFHAFVERNSPDLPIGFLIEAGCYHDLSDEVKAAYEAPFDTPESKWGAATWPGLVPREPDAPGAASQGEVKEALKRYGEPFQCIFARGDPIMRGAHPVLRGMVPTASDEPETWVEEAGHFLQEDAGEEIAEHIVAFVDRRPLD